jgi:hypothetical protein
MRYVTATIGAILIFVGCVVGCFVLTAFRPFQGVFTVSLGAITFTIRNPVAFAGIPLGLLAAAHSFRSTLKRYAIESKDKPRANQNDAPGSN